MLKFFFLATGILLLNATSSHSAETIGFRQIVIDQGAPRSLNVALWYPTNSQSKPESTGENVAFYGISAIKDATPLQSQHPFDLISHGYGGNWRNLNWLPVSLSPKAILLQHRIIQEQPHLTKKMHNKLRKPTLNNGPNQRNTQQQRNNKGQWYGRHHLTL